MVNSGAQIHTHVHTHTSQRVEVESASESKDGGQLGRTHTQMHAYTGLIPVSGLKSNRPVRAKMVINSGAHIHRCTHVRIHGTNTSQRVKVESASESEDGGQLGRSDEGVSLRIGVVSSGEISVVRSHDRVLLACDKSHGSFFQTTHCTMGQNQVILRK